MRFNVDFPLKIHLLEKLAIVYFSRKCYKRRSLEFHTFDLFVFSGAPHNGPALGQRSAVRKRSAAWQFSPSQSSAAANSVVTLSTLRPTNKGKK